MRCDVVHDVEQNPDPTHIQPISEFPGRRKSISHAKLTIIDPSISPLSNFHWHFISYPPVVITFDALLTCT